MEVKKKDNDIEIPSGEWDPMPEQEIPGRILAIDDEVDSWLFWKNC